MCSTIDDCCSSLLSRSSSRNFDPCDCRAPTSFDSRFHSRSAVDNFELNSSSEASLTCKHTHTEKIFRLYFQSHAVLSKWFQPEERYNGRPSSVVDQTRPTDCRWVQTHKVSSSPRTETVSGRPPTALGLNKKKKNKTDLDCLFETGNLFVQPFAFPIQPVVLALKVRVLLLQLVQTTQRMTQTLHRLVQFGIFRLEISRLVLNRLHPSL